MNSIHLLLPNFLGSFISSFLSAYFFYWIAMLITFWNFLLKTFFVQMQIGLLPFYVFNQSTKICSFGWIWNFNELEFSMIWLQRAKTSFVFKGFMRKHSKVWPFENQDAEKDSRSYSSLINFLKWSSRKRWNMINLVL